MSRVTVEVQKSVRIRTLTKWLGDKERVTRSKAYTSPHTAAQAYAQSSAQVWSWRNGIGSHSQIFAREKKVYRKVRPYFDKLFS